MILGGGLVGSRVAELLEKEIEIKRPRDIESKEIEDIRNKLLETYPDLLSGKI